MAGVQKLRERGGKVIIIDIRDTPASRNLADIFLKINPGTDGALALGMAKLIIDNGWADREYIENIHTVLTSIRKWWTSIPWTG